MALPFPDIPPAIFTIPAVHLGSLVLGPLSVRWYALAYIAGILLGWRYAVTLVRNLKLWGPRGAPITVPQIDDMILWITIGIIAGGRIGYVLFYMLPLASGRASLSADPLEVFKLWEGGMSFHGGTIGVIIALVLFARLRKIDLIALADMVAACVPIGLGFGRVANFINGELWGRVTTTSPLGMVFCGRHIATNADGSCVAGLSPRYPSQLFEATLEGLALFLVIRLATHRLGWFKRQGAVTGLFLLGYGLARTSLENVRMPDAGLQNLPYGLTMGMMLSAPMILGGLFLLWRAFRRSNDPLPAT
jgi:phosphatidylglycerol:prolipoprotein diacylglycerol transferase